MPVKRYGAVLVQSYLVSQPTAATRAAFEEATRNFMAEGVQRVAIIRQALDGSERSVAVRVAEYLPTNELQELLGELLTLASWVNSEIKAARDLVKALPRRWVLAHINEAAEPVLQRADEEQYRRFLELYSELDRDRAAQLARRAAASTDPDIREVGEEFLSRLAQT
jgi:hypothetical protein